MSVMRSIGVSGSARPRSLSGVAISGRPPGTRISASSDSESRWAAATGESAAIHIESAGAHARRTDRQSFLIAPYVLQAMITAPESIRGGSRDGPTRGNSRGSDRVFRRRETLSDAYAHPCTSGGKPVGKALVGTTEPIFAAAADEGGPQPWKRRLGGDTSRSPLPGYFGKEARVHRIRSKSLRQL